MPESIVSLFNELNYWLIVLLFLAGILAFVLSTISGGGGALVLIPILNRAIGVENTAPVLNLGTFIGRPARLFIFWNDINWRVCMYYAPSAIIGAYIGAFVFSSFKLEFLQIFIGIFLISTIFQYRFGKKSRTFTMHLWYFIPLGLIVSILGTITGALGPILNPFYLNLGLDKEKLIATKTANSFLMGIAQIGSYSFFGLLSESNWIYGISLGLGATAGNIIGKKFLSNISSITFRRLLIAFMVISGTILIYNQIFK
ncbi:MAG: sulfite exporter TauE/SafE family protein [Chitinophagales bacterium]